MGMLFVCAATTLTGCSDSALDPDPLSFFEPTTTFSTESGLSAALAQADRNLKLYYTTASDVLLPVATEFLFSDMLVVAATDKQAGIYDIANDLIPSSGYLSASDDGTHMHSIMHFWNENYAGIKYANTIIGYAPKVTTLDEATRNAYIGRAYFHRAFRYYALVHQFGDVPLITKLLEVPKQSYKSTKREAILEMIEADMKQAVEWVPDQEIGKYTNEYPGGYVNKAACRFLLAKILMAEGKFNDAKQQLDILINNSGFALMTEPFGEDVQPAGGNSDEKTWTIKRNVIWDMHRGENVYNTANKELILGIPNSGENLVGYTIMRCMSPFVFNNAIKSPSGKQALQNYNRRNGNWRAATDYQRVIGRGVASFRPCTWAQYGLWDITTNTAYSESIDRGDLRRSEEYGNWMHMENLKYNDPTDTEWYGKPLQKFDDKGNLLCNDTIRRWYDIPLYKFYYLDAVQEANLSSDGFRGAQKGSKGDLYLYRLAEAYLLRAEANYYLGDITAATKDVNIIRQRAHCDQLYEKVDIDDIFDERARELYLEEWRHVELVRASFDLAISGKPDKAGNTYTLSKLTQESGTEKTGGSFWYQRCITKNFYNDGITKNVTANKNAINYRIDKKNMFWPIPDEARTSNKDAELHQNYGYPGYDASVQVFSNWQDAVADEDVI